MLNDVKWSEDGTYSPQGIHKPIEFFNDALKNSTEFDLELGYFNSAAINVLSWSFASFIKNGGIMRMAINHIVSAKDKETIENGLNGNIEAPFDLSNFEELAKALDEYSEHFFRCIAFLIQEHRIEIRIIKPKDTDGLAHTKRGLFSDGNTTIVFSGSANFTLGGFFNNREEITLAFSTSPDIIVQKRIANRKVEFDSLMNGNDSAVEYLSVEKLEEAIRTQYGKQDIEELLDVEEKLREYKKKEYKIEQDFDVYELTPSFPYGKPRDYQQQAFENWKNNDQMGLFAMATGTGKTITSLNCLLEVYNRFKYYKALILVPTLTLVSQWENECHKFNFYNIITVSSKNTSWKSQIKDLVYQEKSHGYEKVSYIVISTYASYVKPSNISLINQLSNKTLLIADEAHNMGANNIRQTLKNIPFLRRIGLSATPERQFDDVGNLSIDHFFSVNPGEYTYEYSMKEAIENDVLCRYFYYPHIVKLNEKEMTEYQELSLKIAKYFSVNKDAFENKDKILTGLLLKRKRIIHKATNKQEIFRQIMSKRLSEKGNLKYSLIYVPEGNKPYDEDADIFSNDEIIYDDELSDKLIDIYSKIICDLDPHVTVKKFTSDSKERETILRSFANGNIDVLTSMKCLDEGVDVPRSELAIFCASTGNPRQFIQRRGRILRQAKPYKKFAYIHDLIVAPEINNSSNSFEMERSLLKQELRRVNNFALLSENKSFTFTELKQIMDYYNLTLFDLS